MNAWFSKNWIEPGRLLAARGPGRVCCRAMHWRLWIKQRENLLSWLAIGLVILGSSIIRLRLLNLPLERDEGEYAYMAQQLLHGVPPYVSAYSMKLPGIYAAYTLNMLIFGQTIAGIHLGLVVANSATILLMFILGKRLLGTYGGVMAGAAFAFLALGNPVLGLTANAEHFVLLPLVAGLLLLLRALDDRSDRLLLLSGFLFGCALLMKQHAVFFIPFGALVIVQHFFSVRPTPKTALVKKILLFSGASMVPLALTCLVYVGLGEFHQFWFWTAVFPRSYVTSTSLSSGVSNLTATFDKLITWAPLLWLLAGFGLASLFLERNMKLRIFLVVLLVASFVAVTPGFFFRGHYFVLCLPAVSLLAACGMDYCRRALTRMPLLTGREFATFAVILVAVFWHSAFPQRELLLQMSPNAVSRELYLPDTFSFAAPVSVADYIKAHSDRDAKVAVIGSEPEIYFYLDRPAATEFIYLYYLTEQHRFTDQMRQEFIAQLEAAPPRYLVYSPSWNSELVSAEARSKLSAWFEQFVKSRYCLLGVADMVSAETIEYRWGKDAEKYTPRARLRMLVYEQKPGGSQP